VSAAKSKHSPATVAMFLPALAGGGAERVFVDLANEFSALGFRVDLVLATARGPYIDDVSPAVRVVDLAVGRVLNALPGLVRYLRTERPGVLVSGLDHSNLVAVLAAHVAATGTRCVVSVRSVPASAYRGDPSLRGWFLWRLSRLIYRLADAIIANSRAAAREIAHSGPAVSGKLHVVHNPLNILQLQTLSAVPLNHPWCAAAAPPLILGVGSLTRLKDFPTLIRAFAQLRSFGRTVHLVILGEGPERGPLEQLIGELGLTGEVYLPGFVRNPFAWMHRASVFVSSSLTEGCPNALMQALACGIPVVATDCEGGSAEVLEEGRWGRLVNVGDATAIAAAISSVLDDTQHPDVQRRAAEFGLRRVALQYLQLLLPHEQLSERTP
jgi:glycosyltransferase involved in cell wall biosynthesis